MTEDHPFNNRTMYGATKIAGEQFFRAFHEQHGLDYVGLRYMNVYGPRMDYKGTYVSVIMKVLDRIDQGLRRSSSATARRPTTSSTSTTSRGRTSCCSWPSDATDDSSTSAPASGRRSRELVDCCSRSPGQIEPEYQPQEQMFVTHRVGSTGARAEQPIGFARRSPARRRTASMSVEWWRAQPKRAAAGATEPMCGIAGVLEPRRRSRLESFSGWAA